MALRQFGLPDLGEGLTEGEILRWLVAEGEEIALNQPICEVETAKAAVELPSPFAGRVVTLHQPEGATVEVGAPLISVQTAGSDPGLTPAPQPAPAVPHASADDLIPDLPDPLDPAAAEPGGRTAVLVGYGPRSGAVRRRARIPAAPPGPAAASPAPASSAPASPAPASPAPVGPTAAGAGRVLTKPPVRRLARDLGVDLGAVRGSGADGLVLRADVEAAATQAVSRGGGEPGETRIPIRGVRRRIAEAMVASAFTAPHVTEFLTCDVTPSVELLGRLRALPEFTGGAVGPLLLAAKALLVACRRHPDINASWDEGAGEIVLHGAVNLGIAADTPRGLIVPNIKAAESLSLAGLAVALAELTATARAGQTLPADMTGGTITITNVGVFGVDTGTPILNPGEAAILCLGAIADRPWVVDGQLVVRKVTTLSMSFDHRLVDGRLGSQVLADVGAMLADPSRLVGWQ